MNLLQNGKREGLGGDRDIEDAPQKKTKRGRCSAPQKKKEKKEKKKTVV